MKFKQGNLKVRDFNLSVKAVGDDGTFSGYGSVFGVVDSYKEIVAPSAFDESLAELKAKGRPVPVLWMHRADSPIGIWEDLHEDDHGLHGSGKLLINDVAQAREAHALMKARAVSGLSIGYWVRESTYDEKTGIRTLTKLDLVEISLVTFPANDEARVEAVKFKLARGQLPTLPEFETYLREAGFSKSQRVAIANHGLSYLLRSESEGAANCDGLKSITDTLAGFKLPDLGA